MRAPYNHNKYKDNHMKISKKNVKEIVRQNYDQIASQSKQQNQSSCCGGTDCCSGMDYSVFNDDYSEVKGYNEDADLVLGCGIPTDYAGLQKGDVVLDLGSGAGNDCFVARSLVGAEGFVYGIDFSDVVTVGDLPESLQKSAEMYAGCVAGAISREGYLKVIKDAGFFKIQVHKEKEIILPDEILDSYLSSKEKETFKSSAIGIYSITVTAEKSES